MKRKNVFWIFGFLLFPLCMSGQDPSEIRFVNTGKMAVAPNSANSDKSTLYIPWSVRTMGGSDAVIYQQGKTSIAGSFYHDAASNAFTVDASGWGTGTGTINFFDLSVHAKTDRYIRTKNAADMASFDRSLHYAAFPSILINTNDRIVLDAKMGIDAATVKQGAGKTGILYLESTVYGDKVFDASLRISESGTSSSLVAPGVVVIERNVELYRSTGATDPFLFAFASPFPETQKSGYFAGNWVRRMMETGPHGHVQYVMGNTPSTSDPSIIAREQYVIDAEEKFEPGKGYLVKMQPVGYQYGDKIDFVLTGGSNHDLPEFVFDGQPYSLNPDGYKEQLFAEDVLFTKTLSEPSGSFTSTVNWVIGNSYSAALDASQIAAQINSTGLYMYAQIYAFPMGSTTWQPYYISGGSPQLIDLKDIPSQSVFMVRAAKGAHAQIGKFEIDYQMQTHGVRPNNLRSDKDYDNEILFRLSPESSPNLYDLTVVGLRSQTTGSAEKISVPQSDAFQTYTLSGSTAQSINVLQEGTKSVVLCTRSSSQGGRYTLTAQRQESLQTEGIWLEDLLTSQTIDLRTTDSYTFDMDAADISERFVVHFTAYAPTSMDNATDNFLTCFYSNGEIVIKGLNVKDLHSNISILDMQGRIILSTKVKDSSELRLPFAASEGVYIVKLQGERNLTLKFKK